MKWMLLLSALITPAYPALAQDLHAYPYGDTAQTTEESSSATPAAETEYKKPVPPVPSGRVYDEAPYNKSPTKMSTTTCRTSVVNCGTITESLAVQEAGECIDQAFDLPTDLMGQYTTSGEFENCVIPLKTKAVAGADKPTWQWPVCCYRASDATGNSETSCKLYCSLFMGY